MDPRQKAIRQLHAKKAEIDEAIALLESDLSVRKLITSMASVGVTMPGEYKRRKRTGLHWTQKPENRKRVMDHLSRMAVRIDRSGTTTTVATKA